MFLNTAIKYVKGQEDATYKQTGKKQAINNQVINQTINNQAAIKLFTTNKKTGTGLHLR